MADDAGDPRVYCGADTFLTDPTEYYVGLTDLEGDVTDPAELRTLAAALLRSAE